MFAEWLEKTWEFMEITPPGGRLDIDHEEFIAALKEAYEAGVAEAKLEEKNS